MLAIQVKCHFGIQYCMERYIVQQRKIQVIKYLENNHLCGFEIAVDTPPYKVIRGRGVAAIKPDLGKISIINTDGKVSCKQGI